MYKWLQWILAIVFGLFLLPGCVSYPSKDADLTTVYRPIAGNPTELSIPAKALDENLEGVFTYKGSENKNITFRKSKWYPDGQLQDEVVAGGSRSDVIDSTSEGISSIEDRRLRARLEQLTITLESLERTFNSLLQRFDQFIPILQQRLTPVQPPAPGATPGLPGGVDLSGLLNTINELKAEVNRLRAAGGLPPIE